MDRLFVVLILSLAGVCHSKLSKGRALRSQIPVIIIPVNKSKKHPVSEIKSERQIMENENLSPSESKRLSGLIAAYANIWADVILDKNLNMHLDDLNRDLEKINELIDGREDLKQPVLPFYRIANQLTRMREVIRKKISKQSAYVSSATG